MDFLGGFWAVGFVTLRAFIIALAVPDVAPANVAVFAIVVVPEAHFVFLEAQGFFAPGHEGHGFSHIIEGLDLRLALWGEVQVFGKLHAEGEFGLNGLVGIGGYFLELELTFCCSFGEGLAKALELGVVGINVAWNCAEVRVIHNKWEMRLLETVKGGLKVSPLFAVSLCFGF